MKHKTIYIALVLVLAFTTIILAQQKPQTPAPQAQAQQAPRTRTPYEQRRIDMYFGNWRESMPGLIHGGIVTRSILTKGDPLNPPYKGAVLKYVNAFVHGTLDAGASTTPSTLKGEQEIYFFLGGQGTLTAGKDTAKIYPGIAVLMPANLEFTLKCTGSENLTMFIVTEPIPEGFRPNAAMLVRDENTMAIDSTTGHWVHIVKYLFETEDGLGTLERILTVALDPMTIADQHPHGEGTEEVWTEYIGTSLAFIGRQIRKQPPGTAFMIPPDGVTTHSNINDTDEQAKFFYFARYGDHEVRK